MPCDDCAAIQVAYAEEKMARRWAEEVLTRRVAHRDDRIAVLEAELARYRSLFTAPAIDPSGSSTATSTHPPYKGPQISSPPS